jgi:iron(III) transport system substrate-binding protein
MSDILRPVTLGNPWVSRRQILQGAGAVAGAAALGGTLTPAAAADSAIWYAGSAVDAIDAWTKLFKERSGIQVDYVRSGAVQLTQKFEQEAKAGRVQASILDIAVPGPGARWAKEGLLLKYDSPEYSHYPQDIMIPGFAGPPKAEVLCMAYNPKFISADEAPKHWEDLLDPKWKGKMTMSDAASSSGALMWYAAIRSAYGRAFMEKLAKQDIVVRTGSGDVVNTIVSGERPLAAMLLQYHVFLAVKKGANLNIVVPEEGAPISFALIGIPAAAPNPEVGKKFIDFCMGREAQIVWQDRFSTSSLRDDVPPLIGASGSRPLSQVKHLKSSAEDVNRYFLEQETLIDEWTTLFKS